MHKFEHSPIHAGINSPSKEQNSVSSTLSDVEIAQATLNQLKRRVFAKNDPRGMYHENSHKNLVNSVKNEIKAKTRKTQPDMFIHTRKQLTPRSNFDDLKKDSVHSPNESNIVKLDESMAHDEAQTLMESSINTLKE